MSVFGFFHSDGVAHRQVTVFSHLHFIITTRCRVKDVRNHAKVRKKVRNKQKTLLTSTAKLHMRVIFSTFSLEVNNATRAPEIFSTYKWL